MVTSNEQYLLVLIFSVDCLSSINGSIGTQMLQYENASLLVDAVCKFEELLDPTPIALAVEQHIETDEGKTGKLLSNDECEDADRLEIVNPQGSDILLEKVDEAKLRNQTESCTKMKKVLEDICGSFKGLKEIRHDTEEIFRDSTLKQLSSSCAPHLVPSISFNDKIQQFPTTSPQCQKRRSAVIRVSVKRKSKDGDETTEFCKYTYFVSFCSFDFIIKSYHYYWLIFKLIKMLQLLYCIMIMEFLLADKSHVEYLHSYGTV